MPIHVDFYHGVWDIGSPIRPDIGISHRVLSKETRYYSPIEDRVFASGIDRFALDEWSNVRLTIYLTWSDLIEFVALSFSFIEPSLFDNGLNCPLKIMVFGNLSSQLNQPYSEGASLNHGNQTNIFP